MGRGSCSFGGRGSGWGGQWQPAHGGSAASRPRRAAHLAPAPPACTPQYLSLLLAAPDAAVVLATLQTLAAFVRKSGSPTTRWAGAEDLNARLIALAGAWGGGDDAPDLLACARPGEGHISKVGVLCLLWGGARAGWQRQRGVCSPARLPVCLSLRCGPSLLLLPLQAPTTLHFQFYAAAAAQPSVAAEGGAGGCGGLRVIEVPHADRLPESGARGGDVRSCFACSQPLLAALLPNAIVPCLLPLFPAQRVPSLLCAADASADHELLARLVREYEVPLDKRFALLHKVCPAGAACSADTAARTCLMLPSHLSHRQPPLLRACVLPPDPHLTRLWDCGVAAGAAARAPAGLLRRIPEQPLAHGCAPPACCACLLAGPRATWPRPAGVLLPPPPSRCRFARPPPQTSWPSSPLRPSLCSRCALLCRAVPLLLAQLRGAAAHLPNAPIACPPHRHPPHSWQRC